MILPAFVTAASPQRMHVKHDWWNGIPRVDAI
jgi:hypothetical protein